MSSLGADYLEVCNPLIEFFMARSCTLIIIKKYKFGPDINNKLILSHTSKLQLSGNQG